MAKHAATKHKKELLKGGPSPKVAKVNPPLAAAAPVEAAAVDQGAAGVSTAGDASVTGPSTGRDPTQQT